MSGNRSWIWNIVVAVFGMLIGAAISFYTFVQQQEEANRHMEINLVCEISKRFSEDKNYKSLMQTLEGDQMPVWKDWGGNFNHQEINDYLNFFESLGFYYDYGIMTQETIDYFFGSYLIEAHANNQIREYIKVFRRNCVQPGAFSRFENLVQLLRTVPERDVMYKIYSGGRGKS